MHITSEQIDRFLKGTCTDEEAAVIALYLEENPAVLQDHLKQDWELADGHTPLQPGLQASMYRQIEKQAFKAGMTRTVKRVLWAAAAAIVSIFVTLGALQRNGSKLPVLAAVKEKKTSREQLLTGWEEHKNDSTTQQLFTLPDGTAVSLFVHSAIRFRQPFGQENRTVILRGKASFKVTGNANKPLIVYAGPVAITVLGTYFRVHEEKRCVTVKLYAGKVMVAPASKQVVYLNPGQQLVYNIPGDTLSISAFTASRKDSASIEPADENLLSFHGTPMHEVLNALSARYHTPVMYNRAEIENIYFTGAVLPSDSLMTILHVMGKMNGLSIEAQHDTIIVKKLHR